MRILILEDNKKRQGMFKQNLIGHIVSITESTKEAIALLETEEWDILFLDHDLNQQTYVTSGPGTGYEVAEWLSVNKDRMPSKVYVHSFNEKGTSKILEVLPEAVAAPGVWVNPTELLSGESEVGDVPGMSLRGRLWVPGSK